MKMRLLVIGLATAVVLVSSSVFGQAGVSSMSMGVARAGISRINAHGGYMMPSPDMFRIEEFVNYHRHELPLPDKGRRVHLDVRQMTLPNGKTIFQFGIATPRAIDPETLPPLNVVLVIDRSGSMSGDRISNVKKAVRSFIERFRASDKVTIVGFSDQAQVHLEACRKTEYERIAQALDGIRAGGGTNLYAGLMLGYSEALKHYDAERTNRVIFLTDGNANVGITESEEIARRSKQCNDRGISLSTIGLGVDFNHGLLRQLADAGRGLVHYVGDSKDIEKTFVAEIDSLLAPAARNVRLKIDFGEPSATPKIFGYAPHQKKHGKYVFRLDDLNHGATQVVLARVPTQHETSRVSATLKYTDAITGEGVELRQTPQQFVSLDTGVDPIRRNYAIALVASSLRSAAEASEEGDCRKAEARLAKGIQKALMHVDYPDQHLERILKIARDYRKEILDCIARRRD